MPSTGADSTNTTVARRAAGQSHPGDPNGGPSADSGRGISPIDGARRLAHHLPIELLQEALVVARGIEDERDRAHALVALIPQLPAEYFHEALTVVQEIEDEKVRGPALVVLPQLLAEQKDEIIRETLMAARAMENEQARAWTLARLAPHLATLLPPDLHSLWCEVLHILATRTRHELFQELCALSPILVALGGDEAAAETFRVIQDIGRRWP